MSVPYPIRFCLFLTWFCLFPTGPQCSSVCILSSSVCSLSYMVLSLFLILPGSLFPTLHGSVPFPTIPSSLSLYPTQFSLSTLPSSISSLPNLVLSLFLILPGSLFPTLSGSISVPYSTRFGFCVFSVITC